VFNREGCLGCHHARGVGGIVGPDLTAQGEKTKHEYSFQNIRGEQTVSNWLKEHFHDPEMVSPGSQMLKINLPEEDLDALVTFTLGLAKPDIPFGFFSVETLSELKGARNFLGGEKLYNSCCSACHGKKREGKNYNEYKNGVPALENRDMLSVASSEFITFTIINGRGARQMASWLPEFSGLYEREIDSVAGFIRNERKDHSSFEGIINLKGIGRNGQIIYDSNCRMCHGDDGKGMAALALNNPDIQRIITDRFYCNTIRNGRYNTAMPSWYWLTDRNLADLLALIRSWGSEYSSIPVINLPDGDPQQGALQFHYLCSRCHGEFGEGETGPAILNKDFLTVANNNYLYMTVAFGRARTAMFGWKGQLAGEESIGDKQISDIIAYMRSIENKTWDYIFSGANPGNSNEGEKLYVTNCMNCHGENGTGTLAPQINNQEFLNAATNGYLLAAISLGRTGTDMPSWGRGDGLHPALSGKERQDIVAFLRSWQVVRIKR
jgi:cytochrome c oxidase cbb3-type subunit 3